MPLDALKYLQCVNYVFALCVLLQSLKGTFSIKAKNGKDITLSNSRLFPARGFSYLSFETRKPAYINTYSFISFISQLIFLF